MHRHLKPDDVDGFADPENWQDPQSSEEVVEKCGQPLQELGLCCWGRYHQTWDSVCACMGTCAGGCVHTHTGPIVPYIIPAKCSTAGKNT